MVGPDYVRRRSTRPGGLAPRRKGRPRPRQHGLVGTVRRPGAQRPGCRALRENKDLLIASARVDEYAGRYGFVRAELFPAGPGPVTTPPASASIPPVISGSGGGRPSTLLMPY